MSELKDWLKENIIQNIREKYYLNEHNFIYGQLYENANFQNIINAILRHRNAFD